ncbi:unnamed protein product [Kuraishia capsulata CBS 1993]|uniref:Altered inheritance of mitochondria protein 24, mitochondrial n=1 Tax=Kuraishia capsulata CBS 1993 TaxID=1382522 RepID=W6MG93_9ASCO|nr:uncharacterized protein KUCA_T00001006001 [Kuraishia capsulata CBS 1993]CDK25039.1 unnamed protein product [Kuraishia capsulata CBS 1993]
MRHTIWRQELSKLHVFKRSITILQTPSVTSAATLTTTTSADQTEVSAVPKAESIPKTIASGDEPIFTTIGTPPSILTVSIPPSVPIYLKKGSLMSLYGGGNGSIINKLTSSLEIRNAVSRFYYGGISSTYQKITSTVPLNALVSAFEARKLSRWIPNRSDAQRSFVNLVLDGRIDWVIVPPKAIQCYTGASLFLNLHVFPRASGLFRAWNAGYTLANGRGTISLVGDGQVYKITLGEGEELLLKRESILAISVNGHSELSNGSISGKTLSRNLKETEKTEETGPEPIINPDDAVTENKYWTQLKTVASWTTEKAAKLIGFASGSLNESLVGNGGFVQVKGPRSILLQTGSGTDKISLGNQPGIADTEKFITEKGKFLQPQRSSADFLKYATVKDGKVEFKSTPDFSKTVAEIRGQKA